LELPQLRGSVSFNNVWFHYPTRPAAKIFKGLSFKVEAGEVVGIVGQSGGGKSTVGNLLLRYYDPESGVIKIDGHDVRTLNPSWWRRQVGVVSQEPVLFTGTISDNIAYGVGGQSQTTLDKIKEAADFANARQFIEALPDGFETLVGERGVNLSGGQKQRIAIARALLTNPKLLLFDEATSALDSESEYLVQQALDRLMVGRTVITIAHRLSTIRKASRIFVVDDGFVLEEGSWDDLMAKPDGVFRKMHLRRCTNARWIYASIWIALIQTWTWFSGVGALNDTALLLACNMASADFEELRQLVVGLVAGGMGPKLVRLAHADASSYSISNGMTGGMRGTLKLLPNSTLPAGLATAMSLLEDFKINHAAASYADIWAYAGAVTIAESKGPTIPYRCGRKDYVSGQFNTASVPQLSATWNSTQIRARYSDMGFTDSEMIAIFGGRTLG
ncbi:ATP-binding cassette sub- B member 10, mitochondrial, partial [Gonapodya sp. JEL0774]